MEKRYKANLKKASKHGYDPDWTGISVEDGIAISCSRGTHYAGCSCRLDDRTNRCTQETARNCIDTVISFLDDKDIAEIGKVELPTQ